MYMYGWYSTDVSTVLRLAVDSWKDTSRPFTYLSFQKQKHELTLAKAHEISNLFRHFRPCFSAPTVGFIYSFIQFPMSRLITLLMCL